MQPLGIVVPSASALSQSSCGCKGAGEKGAAQSFVANFGTPAQNATASHLSGQGQLTLQCPHWGIGLLQSHLTTQ